MARLEPVSPDSSLRGIHLPSGVSTLGRGEQTGVKENRVSRKQLEVDLSPDGTKLFVKAVTDASSIGLLHAVGCCSSGLF
jgi:hypothetical protein